MNERSFNVKALCFPPYYIGEYRTPAPPNLPGERGLLARSSRQPAANSRCQQLKLRNMHSASCRMLQARQPVLPGNRTERWTLNVGRWTFAS